MSGEQDHRHARGGHRARADAGQRAAAASRAIASIGSSRSSRHLTIPYQPLCCLPAPSSASGATPALTDVPDSLAHQAVRVDQDGVPVVARHAGAVGAVDARVAARARRAPARAPSRWLRSGASAGMAGSFSPRSGAGAPAASAGVGKALASSGLEKRASATAWRARSSSESGARSVLVTNPCAPSTSTRRPRPRVALCFTFSMAPPFTRTLNERVPPRLASACDAPARARARPPRGRCARARPRRRPGLAIGSLTCASPPR